MHDHLLTPLEEVIRCKLLPAITGQSVFDDNLRKSDEIASTPRGNRCCRSFPKGSIYYENSKSITTLLVNIILDQARVCPPEITKAQINAKNYLHNSRSQHERIDSQIIDKLPPDLQRLVEICETEKGASTWLTTLPLSCHVFSL